jgi:hypothetical protein
MGAAEKHRAIEMDQTADNFLRYKSHIKAIVFGMWANTGNPGLAIWINVTAHALARSVQSVVSRVATVPNAIVDKVARSIADKTTKGRYTCERYGRMAADEMRDMLPEDWKDREVFHSAACVAAKNVYKYLLMDHVAPIAKDEDIRQITERARTHVVVRTSERDIISGLIGNALDTDGALLEPEEAVVEEDWKNDPRIQSEEFKEQMAIMGTEETELDETDYWDIIGMIEASSQNADV